MAWEKGEEAVSEKVRLWNSRPHCWASSFGATSVQVLPLYPTDRWAEGGRASSSSVKAARLSTCRAFRSSR